MPGHPEGKAAGVVCSNLDRESLLCTIWGTPAYPEVCRKFRADERYCGKTPAEAFIRLAKLEKETRPA
ncbi:MAG: YkgJ family cysteine cluster protein [Spirochaetales bacterium]|nr:YkgJ family cysteine cluster protein [Spirochaetales bacterium]